MKAEEKTGAVKRIDSATAFFQHITMLKKRINMQMEGKYSPSIISMLAAAFASLLILLMLFLPNYLGTADDGTLHRVMDGAGISYLQGNSVENSNEYFVKTYSNIVPFAQQADKMFNSQIVILKAALWLDNLITGDHFFDIRFLALIYSVFYIPAIYLLIRQTCLRVKTFSEGFSIGITGVVIFTDVAYITYFNSFYPEAVWFISLLYCLGAALSFQEDRSMGRDICYLTLLVSAGIVLTLSRRQCAFIGMVLMLLCLKLMFARKEWSWRVICVLADVSTYEEVPFVEAEVESLEKEFLDQYTMADITWYYLRHPGKFLGMADIAIKSCFGIRRDYCGNYERSVGLPGGARSIFWSMWSTFKNNSAPKTIGFLIILIGSCCLLFGKGYSLKPEEDRRNTVIMDGMAALLLICLGVAGITIVGSGDAEMVQHCFLIGCCMDLMTYFVFAEIVHRINIF
ncbi:MAG: hypothetical protein PUG54_11700 [Firmicutes bacterium]|nr:hypothetical protein [Bacillota bacterium]